MALAKLATPEVVGRYGLAVAICMPVMFLSRMNLRSVLATDAHQEIAFRHYLNLTAICTIAALATIAAIGCYLGNASRVGWVIGVVGLAFAAESFSEITYGLLQHREQMDRIGKSLMLRGSGMCLAFVIVFAATRSLLAAVSAAAGASIAVLAIYDVPCIWQALRSVAPTNRSRGLLIRDRERLLSLVKLARLAAPLAVVTAVIALSFNIPRYFIELHLGERELGVFTAMASVIAAGNILVGGLCQAAIPRLARCAAQRDIASFRRLVGILAATSLALGVAGVLAATLTGERVLHWLFTAEYASQQTVFVLLMIAAAIQYLGNVFGAAIISMRRFVLPLPVQLITLGAVLGGSAFLIKDFGLPAAAGALIVNALVPTVIFAYVTLSSQRHNVWHGSNAPVSYSRT